MVMFLELRVPRSTFEPRHSKHCTLHKESLDRLLARIEESVPTTGLQQFWLTKTLVVHVEVTQILWNYVIFSHKHFSTVMRDKFFTPTIAQCYDYPYGMILNHDKVAQIEAATQDQSEFQGLEKYSIKDLIPRGLLEI